MDEKKFREAMAAKGINSMAELSRQTEIPYSTLLYKWANDTWEKNDIKTISNVLSLNPQQTVIIFDLGCENATV